jgi:hypothetical protein
VIVITTTITQARLSSSQLQDAITTVRSEALAYLQQQGVDTTKLTILYSTNP